MLERAENEELLMAGGVLPPIEEHMESLLQGVLPIAPPTDGEDRFVKLRSTASEDTGDKFMRGELSKAILLMLRRSRGDSAPPPPIASAPLTIF